VFVETEVPESPKPSQALPAPTPSRPGHDGAPAANRSGRPHHARRRWPFGSGFHEPDFDAPIDLEMHLSLLPFDATCKGVFFSDVLRQAANVTSEHEIFRVAQVPERRYLRFSDYPLADNMRLAVATSRQLYPRQSIGEGLRRLGQTAFDAVLTTQIGRALFGILGREIEPILLAGPKAFKVMINVGHVTAEKKGPRTFVFHAREMPAFLETYQVGVLEGVVHHCGERGKIRIALDDPSNATLELELL
jgi:uncharacterized protein (TIGR02265 family)